MKKLLFPLIVGISFQLLVVSPLTAQTGTWTALTNQAPHASNGLMLLLTDGTVICTNTSGTGYGTGWDKLTPNAAGSYVNGTWTSIASMHGDRFAFSSQVLPSGKVYVAGGEYGAGGTTGEVYDPVANTWTVCGALPSGWNVYDGPSELLYNGNVLEGPEIGASGGQPCNSILQWNPTTLNYTTENAEPENHDEAAWIKLPDSTVLTVGMPYPNNPAEDSSCRFQPKTNTWLVDAMTPNNIYDQWGFEAGGGYLLPNGQAIFFGATEYNVLYTPSGNSRTRGTWSSAANFPSIGGKVVSQPDAPGAMMVNGHILLAVSPEPTLRTEFATPTYFVEYDYTTNTFTQVTATIPVIGSDEFSNCVSQNSGFLDLPDGNVLMCNNAYSNNPTQYWVYTPGSAAIAQGKPTINSILPDGCPNYKLTGKLFNGISEGTGYGDDIQNSTNFPIIRLTNGTNVYYAKTTNWNRVGAVATDSLEDTVVFTPPALPSGTYSLVVVANGFASNPILFTVLGISSVAETNISCSNPTGSATVTASGGLTPLTYTWNPGGNTNSTATNLSSGTYSVTVTDDNGCTVTASAVITGGGTGSLNVSTQVTSNVTCFGNSNGSATSSISGGAAPFTYNWSSGGTNSIATGLAAGTYTLTAQDSCGSSGTASVIITQPASAVAISIASLTNVLCNGTATGSITATAATGGTSPYSYAWSSGAGTNLTAPNLDAGTYTITATDNNGCLVSDSAIITQPTLLTMVADSMQDNGTCNGSAWAIVNGGTSPYTYLWTGGLTTDTITNQCSSNYCCTVTDANGCIDSVCVTITTTTGINNMVLNGGQLTLYPNPNNGKFTIELPSGSNQWSVAEIYNVLGQIVESHILSTLTTEIDLSAQPSGIYFYRVLKENGGLLGEGKIVIEK